MRYYVPRNFSFQQLEERALLAVTVTQDTSDLAASATAIVIQGTEFDPIVSNNSVVFNNGAVGTVTEATDTALTVEFSTLPTAAGTLTAIVTSTGGSSGAAVQVATVIPVVTSSTAFLPADATSVIIAGVGFDTTAANNTVTFNNGAAGTVSAATSTELTVTFSTQPTTAGTLTAIVTTNSASSASALQVATVTPVITSTTTDLAADSTTVVIDGFGFDATAANNLIDFDGDAIGTVTSASATQLTVTFSTKPNIAGPLIASISTNSISSLTAEQVANVTPVVTTSAANLSASASTIVIAGFAFDPTAANNTVVFNDGAVGTVTAATSTSPPEQLWHCRPLL